MPPMNLRRIATRVLSAGGHPRLKRKVTFVALLRGAPKLHQDWPPRRSRLLLALCGLLCLAGCAVGPNYKRPVIDSPTTFRGQGYATNTSFGDPNWWQVYRDDTLQGLIREALTNNYDLRIAIARVEQARAIAMQTRSQFIPSLNYNGTVSRGRNDVFGSGFPNNGNTANSALATLNAFWEVDLWGRVRRLNESTRAQFLASEEARRGVRLTLVSDVATAFFQFHELIH